MNFKNINLKFLLDINNQLYVHLAFWIGYYLYRVYLYIDIYDNTVYVQFFELFAKIFAVYANLYVLMPFFLKKNKVLYYGLGLIPLFALAVFMQLQVIEWMIKASLYINFNPKFLYSPKKIFSVTYGIVVFVFFVTIAKILKDSYLNQQINQALLQEKLETELKFLKAQINPHFFFNTLNNVYALILAKSDQAADVIVKLSNLMSYMLYETNLPEVSLKKELDYLQDYIELEKLRFGEEMSVFFEVHGESEGLQIAPMLLIPFVENSFKHSVTGGNEKIWIHLEITIKSSVFHFQIRNSLHQVALDNPEKTKAGGIGLKNVRRRLDLLYKNRYSLDIQQNTDSFSVNLVIHVNPQNNG